MSLILQRIEAAVMAALVMLPALIIAGCDDHGADSSATPQSRVVLEDGRTLRLYGRANDWLWIAEDVLMDEVKALDSAGWDGYLIELGGAARWRGHSEAQAREIIMQRYPILIDELGDRGMVLLVSVQNDNAGKGKYGDQSPALEEQVAFSAWLVNLIDAVGRPDVVIVQPVAETESSAGFALEALCASALSEFTLVNNEDGQPSEKPSWANYNATHPWSISAISSEDIIVNDTSTAIVEVDADGDMAGPTSPTQVARFIARCEMVGAKIAGLYVFCHAGDIDQDTISGFAR